MAWLEVIHHRRTRAEEKKRDKRVDKPNKHWIVFSNAIDKPIGQ